MALHSTAGCIVCCALQLYHQASIWPYVLGMAVHAWDACLRVCTCKVFNTAQHSARKRTCPQPRLKQKSNLLLSPPSSAHRHVECGDGVVFPFSRGCSFIRVNEQGKIIQVGQRVVRQSLHVSAVVLTCTNHTRLASTRHSPLLAIVIFMQHTWEYWCSLTANQPAL